MNLDFSQFDAVLFDLDGTLVLTEHVWQAAKKSTAAQHGVHVSDDVLETHVGRRLVDFVSEHLFDPQHRPNEHKSAIDDITSVALERLKDELMPVPGATDLVRYLSRKERRLAICSSAPLSAIHIALDVLSVRECFGQIISAAEMPIGKPDPAPYQKTLDMLGLSASRAMAIEDSIIGVKSAKSAGLFTVAVGGDQAVTDSGLADILYPQLGDIVLT